MTEYQDAKSVKHPTTEAVIHVAISLSDENQKYVVNISSAYFEVGQAGHISIKFSDAKAAKAFYDIVGYIIDVDDESNFDDEDPEEDEEDEEYDDEDEE